MEKRHSKKREAIYEALCSTTAHPSAEDLHVMLNDTMPEISIATIYRNLVEFKRGGKAQSVGIVDGIERFDGNTAIHPHFVCSECHSVIDLDCFELCECFIDTISSKCNVCAKSLVIEGVCNACMQADTAK